MQNDSEAPITDPRPSKSGRMNEGRPTKYEPSILPIAEVIHELRGTDDNLTVPLGVARTTVDAWANEYPEIRDTRGRLKELVDAAVEQAMHKRAVGYGHPDGMHIPANIQARIF